MVDSVSQNQNNHPSAGKLIGAGVGLTTAGYFWHKASKTLKAADEFIKSDAISDAVKTNNLDKVNSALNASKLSDKSKQIVKNLTNTGANLSESFNIGKESIKITKLGLFPALALFTVLGGLSLGAIVDHFRKD